MCERHFYKKNFFTRSGKKDTLGFDKFVCNYRRENIDSGLLVFIFFFFGYLTSVVSIEVGSETQQVLFANWM